jgi:hypothetical protein
MIDYHSFANPHCQIIYVTLNDGDENDWADVEEALDEV